MISEQHILNCLPENSLWRRSKCQSGTEIEVFKYAMENGLILSKDFEFTGVPERCTQKSGEIKIAGFRQIRPDNIPQLRAALN